MDVDRLRPGTVPLAPETVLWFEFLLDPNLLKKHLSKPNPDPSPTDLIIKFLCVDRKEEPNIVDEENHENEVFGAPKITKRSLAIKLLTMKVMAFLCWDLDILESKLPLPMQVTLLHDLLYIAIEEEASIHSHTMIDLTAVDHQTIFALSFYHRWVLKSYMCGSLATKQPRVPFIPMPGLQDPNLIAANQREEIRSQLDTQLYDSVHILNQMLKKIKTLTVPTMDSFIHITEDTVEVKIKWNTGVEISSEEFKCQVFYDLGSFTFFKGDYVVAKEHFTECYKLFEVLEKQPELKKEVKFCIIDKEKLEGYCKACDVTLSPNIKPTADLYEQYKISIQNKYTGIIQILQADNISERIPLGERDLLEIEIQTALCSGNFVVAKDLVLKVPILNTLRRATTFEIMNLDFTNYLRNAKEKGIEFFLNVCTPLTTPLTRAEVSKLEENGTK